MRRWPVWDIRDMATHIAQPLIEVPESWSAQTLRHLIRTKQPHSIWTALYDWLVRTYGAAKHDLHNLTHVGAVLQTRLRAAESQRLRTVHKLRGEDLTTTVACSNMDTGPQEMFCMRPLGGDGLVIVNEDALSPALLTQMRTWVWDTPSSQRQRRKPLGNKLRFAIMKRDHYRCCLCGVRSSDGPTITLVVDHKLAHANGGPDVPENLWTLCSQCNSGKGDAYL
jgi:hypothetical protein